MTTEISTCFWCGEIRAAYTIRRKRIGGKMRNICQTCVDNERKIVQIELSLESPGDQYDKKHKGK